MSRPPFPVGSIVERKTTGPPTLPSAPATNGTGTGTGTGTGFPSVQHRSKSAFARHRENAQRPAASAIRPAVAPAVHSAAPAPISSLTNDTTADPGSQAQVQDDWRAQISAENARKVELMSEDERASERAEILARFGPDVADVLRRAKAKREQAGQIPMEDHPHETEHADADADAEAGDVKHHHHHYPKTPMPLASPPRPALSLPGSRPPSRADRKLRFAAVQPEDVHVYESAPPSPKRKALALPPPSADDGPTVSLGMYQEPSVPRLPAGADVTSAPEPDSQRSGVDTDAMHNADPEMDVDLEEGTPEDIRRRFFPHIPPNEPSLEWTQSLPSTSTTTTSSASLSSSSPSALRFDLHGRPIPPRLSANLPTHLGLHHHAEGAHAGYTLDDAFLLTRSTVPSQRTAMLALLKGVALGLARLLRRRCSSHTIHNGTQLGNGNEVSEEDEAERSMEQLKGQEESLRGRILAAGVQAIGERGSLGAQAIDVVWTCVVRWNPDLVDMEGAELADASKYPRPHSESKTTISDENSSGSGDALDSLQMDHLLPQISELLVLDSTPAESRRRLLEIVHRLAPHSNAMASSIVSCSGLVANLMDTFLLALPSNSSTLTSNQPVPPPNPLALRTLSTLARASRSNALALVEPADALLRFITDLPPASPLSAELLAGTLRFWTVLARYGLYAGVATTASEPFAELGRYVLTLPSSSSSGDPRSASIIIAWADLLAAWIVCAQDPHQTTPEHDILWSQVVGWGWDEHLLELCAQLRSAAGARAQEASEVWGAVWSALAAWLEGARVNGVKGGEKERDDAVSAIRAGFEEGAERAVVEGLLDALRGTLLEINSEDRMDSPRAIACLTTLSRHARSLAAVFRLFIAALGRSSQDQSGTADAQPEPPFRLPFSRIVDFAHMLTTHPIWARLENEDAPLYMWAYFRPLTSLLSSYLRLSRWIPYIRPDNWLAQAFAILRWQMPGDEDNCEDILKQILALATSQELASFERRVSKEGWDRAAKSAIEPLLVGSVWHTHHGEGHITPVFQTSRSISSAGTQTLYTLRGPSGKSKRSHFTFLLDRDWMLLPLDHLLRSGASEVMKSLPPTWDASETDVTRAALFMACAVCQLLTSNSLDSFIMSREEAVFGCMKIFMLEHEQNHDDIGKEVFRDGLVTEYMGALLRPYAWSASSGLLRPMGDQTQSLETVAARFLGLSTPFFQYYTDFVALYDSVSLAHPIFAALLLPPLSMRYALDYRRHLWCDYAHILRTIRTPIDQSLSGDIREFLYPIEEDPQVIGAYLRALLKGTVEGLLRLIAIHHIACSIWPDLWSGASSDVPESTREQRSSRLLGAVVERGSHECVRDIVLYRQHREGEGPVLIPPDMFQQHGQWRAARLEHAARWGGSATQERLRPLLNLS